MAGKNVARKRNRKGNGTAQISPEYLEWERVVAAVNARPGNMSPLTAYRRLRAIREEEIATSTKLERKRTAENAQARRAAALGAINPALKLLADVRDLIECIKDGRLLKDGRLQHFTPDALAAFASAGLKEAGTELEQSIFDLGLLDVKGSPCGWFVGEFTAAAAAAK